VISSLTILRMQLSTETGKALLSLDNRCRIKLGTKHLVPELASDSKAELIIEKMVSEMILLQLPVIEREVLMMEEVVGQVVADIAENATAVHSCGYAPVPEEEGVGELPERRRKGNEQSRRHHEPVAIHG